jgi:hypothetical protein
MPLDAAAAESPVLWRQRPLALARSLLASQRSGKSMRRQNIVYKFEANSIKSNLRFSLKIGDLWVTYMLPLITLKVAALFTSQSTQSEYANCFAPAHAAFDDGALDALDPKEAAVIVYIGILCEYQPRDRTEGLRTLKMARWLLGTIDEHDNGARRKISLAHINTAALEIQEIDLNGSVLYHVRQALHWLPVQSTKNESWRDVEMLLEAFLLGLAGPGRCLGELPDETMDQAVCGS